MNTIFSNPFVGESRENLLKRKLLYEQIIEEQQDNYVSPINAKTGRRKTIPDLKFMLPAWNRGLQMINELLEIK